MQHGDFAGVINSTHQLTLGSWWGHLHTAFTSRDSKHREEVMPHCARRCRDSHRGQEPESCDRGLSSAHSQRERGPGAP